jgi:hypothetical protein
MGNKQATVKNDCIEEFRNINENELDISNIDRLQIKAIKEISNKVKEMEEKKSNNILYRLPVQICNYSLF